MSNQSNEGFEGPEGTDGRERRDARNRPRRRRTKTLAALITVFVVGAVSGGALVAATDAWSHRGGGAKWRHADPEHWKERMLGHSSRWLGRIDATDEQREAIQGIIGTAADELAGTIGEHRALRREWLTELARPELDAEALEGLRAKHVRMADDKSRQVLDVVIRVGSVLTAEQRNDLLTDFARHRGRHHERRGRRGGEEEG